jgi:hypothetical protein
MNGKTMTNSKFKSMSLFLALCAAASVAADDKGAQPQPTRFRVIGMFSLERQDDLREAMKQLPGVKLASIDFPNAEVVITYDLAQLFPQARPKQVFTAGQIVERLDGLLRPASNHTFSLKLPSNTPKDKLTRIEIGVVGHDCKGCCLGAYEAVAKDDGVLQATVSFTEDRVIALIDPAKTTKAALEAALKKVQVQLKNR